MAWAEADTKSLTTGPTGNSRSPAIKPMPQLSHFCVAALNCGGTSII